MNSARWVFSSAWSERHIAHACGLGTFGLCDGLITPVGKSMRLGSVIAQMPVEPASRPYTDHHAYCLHYARGTCGVCMQRCPVGASPRTDMTSACVRRTWTPRVPSSGIGTALRAMPVACARRAPPARRASRRNSSRLSAAEAALGMPSAERQESRDVPALLPFASGCLEPHYDKIRSNSLPPPRESRSGMRQGCALQGLRRACHLGADGRLCGRLRGRPSDH